MLDVEIAEVIARAKASSRPTEHRTERSDRRARPAMESMSADDKKHMYNDALAGRLGRTWQALALRRDVEIGVWLWFREWCTDAPTDRQLARMWPGCSNERR